MLSWEVWCVRLVHQLLTHPRQELPAAHTDHKRGIPHLLPRCPYATARLLAGLHAKQRPLILIPLKDFAEVVKVLRGFDCVDVLSCPLLVLDVYECVQLLHRDGLVPEDGLEDIQVLNLEVSLHLLLAQGFRLLLGLLQ